MKKITIIGFGRFGKTLYRLLAGDFEIVLWNRSPEAFEGVQLQPNTRIAQSVRAAYVSDVIFYAVPIDAFERVINSHQKYFRAGHVFIDVLSVKMHPERVFRKYLKEAKVQAILTHPMFGPDSSQEGFAGLPLIMDKFMAAGDTYDFWKIYFTGKGLNVLEMSAREHDRLAANSQGLTHFIGRLMESYGLVASRIDSLGTKKLLEVKDQTCNDTWQLFDNLQHFNPYTKRMRIKLGATYDRLYNTLLPRQVSPGRITFGIQGGVGSFNQQALGDYVKRHAILRYDTRYLYTSANVMKALHEGTIDFGLFALQNSVGGMVDESVVAMAAYKFKIVEQFAIKISHALMIRPDAGLADVDTVMSHPQVFAQCRQTLVQKYPHLTLTSGEGELIDHAKVAKLLGEKRLPKNIATMGSNILAPMYGLTVIEDNLQDARENDTDFLLVSRL